jgi:hypothetical protein
VAGEPVALTKQQPPRACSNAGATARRRSPARVSHLQSAPTTRALRRCRDQGRPQSSARGDRK